MKIPKSFSFPRTFERWGSPGLVSFAKEMLLNDPLGKQKVASFRARVKGIQKRNHIIQTYQDRRYIDLALMNLLGHRESLMLMKFSNERLRSDSLFETSELLANMKLVYEQLDDVQKLRLRRRFIGGFDQPLGFIPLSHELAVSNYFSARNFEVELPEFTGSGVLDIRVSKQGKTFDIDCKACGADNGKFFQLEDTDIIYAAIERVMSRHKDKFANHLLTIEPTQEAGVVKDIPAAVRRAVMALISGQSPSDAAVKVDLIPFDALFTEYRRTTPDNQSSQEALEEAKKCVNRSRVDVDARISLEWAFSPSETRSLTKDFFVLFCSSRPVDWRKNSIRVAKKSLSGQLRNSAAPVLVYRYSDLTDSDISTRWFSESVNPLNDLFNDIVGATGVNKLCAMLFVHRPIFEDSVILNAAGHNQTIGNVFIKGCFNLSHPLGAEFKMLI